MEQGIGAGADLIADFQHIALALRHDQCRARTGPRQKRVDANREAMDEKINIPHRQTRSLGDLGNTRLNARRAAARTCRDFINMGGGRPT